MFQVINCWLFYRRPCIFINVVKRISGGLCYLVSCQGHRCCGNFGKGKQLFIFEWRTTLFPWQSFWKVRVLTVIQPGIPLSCVSPCLQWTESCWSHRPRVDLHKAYTPRLCKCSQLTFLVWLWSSSLCSLTCSTWAWCPLRRRRCCYPSPPPWSKFSLWDICPPPSRNSAFEPLLPW